LVDSVNIIREKCLDNNSVMDIKDRYIDQLDDKLHIFKEKMRRFTKREEKKEKEFKSIEPPRWQPNHVGKRCKMCAAKFGLFTRKHHCRVCGDIFCNPCCNIFDTFEPYYPTSVRMCMDCHKDITKKKEDSDYSTYTENNRIN
jgi:hypothetical protein